MRILFVSRIGMATSLALTLQKEGNEVKLYIEDPKLKGVFDFMIEKTKDWRKELDWVKKGLIFFDDSGFGKEQDELREKGFNVFGGNQKSDEVELDRKTETELLKKYKINTFETIPFNNMLEAIEYAGKNKERWVIKRSNNGSKIINYVGEDKNGRDVIMLLKNYSTIPALRDNPMSLQKRVDGIEIGVGRFFNGNTWVGPIEMNVEHPHLFAGGVGQHTDEMGTVAWYTEKENKIYTETLKKLEPFLKEINFKGDIGINCIINKDKIYALEITPRIGSPIIHLQQEIHKSPWGDLSLSISRGEEYKLKYKKGFGIVLSIAVPPFPYQSISSGNISFGLEIDLSKCNKKEINHIYFDEISKRPEDERYYVSGNGGYVCYVACVEKTISKANKKALGIAEKIKVPKVFYRNDVGLKFEKEELPKLKKWGWL